MAGDWIKMRADLATCPKVVRIASALRADRLRVIGGLHAVWCLFDMHSTDGKLDGYTLEALDELICFDGFGKAMESVEWVVCEGESLVIPRFDEHNGRSAKRRAMESERKRDSRKTSACDADNVRTREEKRREELTTSSLRSEVVAPLAVDEPQRKTSGTPKRANQLHEDFEPDETAYGLAAELGVSLSVELPKFRDYHAARGKPMKDWQAALRTWLRNAKAFAKPAPKQSEADRRADWLADITGRKANAIDAPAKLVG